MIELDLTVDDLAAVRFAADPVWETVASLCVLSHPRRHALHHRFLHHVTSRTYDLGLLLDLVSRKRWFPVFLCPEPSHRDASPRQALAAIAGTDPDLAARDLAALRAMDPTNRRWHLLTADQLVRDTSVALLGYWQEVLEPFWDRITGIVEADLAHRAQQLAACGLGGALADVHDTLSFARTTVRVRLPGHHRHLATHGSGLWFVPSVFRWPRIVVEIDTAAPIVGYPARGAGRLWENGSAQAVNGLRQVIGHTRVEVLRQLDTPTTTTRLARQLALSPGTVSAHLTAMKKAGLLEATRSGREVFYQRTALGEAFTSGP